MVAASKLIEILPPGYGAVIGCGVKSVLVNMYLAYSVHKARTTYGVEYPDMYSDKSKEFNCIQRAHQHTLEMYPQFLFLLLVGGLQYPRISAGFGTIYLISRIAFAKGYTSGDIKNRKWGGFGMIGLLGLLGNTVSFGFHCLHQHCDATGACWFRR